MQTKNSIKRVLVTGATGLIGRKLCQALLENQMELVVLGRGAEARFRQKFSFPCTYYQWANPVHELPPQAALDVDAIINLMGEPLAGRRWTEKVKQKLRSSRVDTTRNLVAALEKNLGKTKVIISASAIGIYGDRDEESLTEQSKLSQDFLGKLCQDWEAEVNKSTCRSVQLRFGLVLSNQGGALGEMVPVFERGFGGPLSNGRHWMSWIHINDVIGIALKALLDPSLVGAINCVSPEPVRNQEFTKLLAKSLKVRAILPTPKIALNIVLGEMATVVLASQKVVPEKLQSNNYSVEFKNLEDALHSLYKWKESCHDRLFRQQQWVAKPLGEVFGFFSDANNLEILTPPFLKFKVIKKSTQNIQEGTEIDYRLRVHGISIKWRSKIIEWRPMTQFVDVQVRGPYAKWYHSHLFKPLAGGVLLEDKVIYRIPLSRVGGNLLGRFIAKDIRDIFNYRKEKISEWDGTK